MAKVNTKKTTTTKTSKADTTKSVRQIGDKVHYERAKKRPPSTNTGPKNIGGHAREHGKNKKS